VLERKRRGKEVSICVWLLAEDEGDQRWSDGVEEAEERGCGVDISQPLHFNMRFILDFG
jgi:hypothetical protein